MRVTLADIAKKTGVTISTVQRALNGGGGVGEQKRAMIQKVAADLGYKRNLYASSLRRGYIRVAVVFPDTSPKNRFYSHYLWSGIHRYLESANIPYLEMLPLSYDRSPEDHVVLLQELIDGKHGKIDGIVTRGANTSLFLNQMKAFQQLSIPVVLAGADTRPRHRLCCVRSYEQMAGSLAADLFINFGALQDGKKVVVCGNFSGLNQFNNAQGFERQLWKSQFQPDVLKISRDVEPGYTYARLCEMLEKNPDIGGVYACSTRSTLSACEAVRAAKREGQVRIVGSDLFEESVELLRDGRLHAIIHNRPIRVGQCAIQALVGFLLNEEECPKDVILIDSAIVMKGNLDFYLQDIPALRKYADPEALAVYDNHYQVSEYL